jgi:hypothetical protein
MKNLVTILICLIAFQASGQFAPPPDSISFCHRKFKIPAGCKSESIYQIECSDYKMQWLYMTKEMLDTVPQQLISQLEAQLKSFKKEEIKLLLLGKEVQGYKVIYPLKEGYTYQIIAYGIANGQPVIVQLTLGKNPRSNDDIPYFPRQFVRLY